MSQPKDFLLQSFNAISPQISQDPYSVLNNLLNNLVASVPDDKITRQTSNGHFALNYYGNSTTETVLTSFAVSVGITGNYAQYSGAAQASYTNDQYTSSTSVSVGCTAMEQYGTVYYNNKTDYEAIFSLLKPELKVALMHIASLEDAANFVNKYGTHLIIGVNLGGIITTGISIQTTTIATYESVSASVEAAYRGASSFSAVATSTESEATKYSTEGFTATVKSCGGSPNIASQLNYNNPATYAAFGNSCSIDTVFGPSDTLEYWQMVPYITSTDPGYILRKYLNLMILNQSLNNPSIFFNVVNFNGHYAVVTSSAPADALGKKYKILAGGAATGHQNFLVGSYPMLGSDQNIGGWTASAHDIHTAASSSDTLTSYAICVFDPGNLLSVNTEINHGDMPQEGGHDTATATVDSTYTMVGGGCNSESSGNYNKFINASYPFSSNSWTANNQDYHNGAYATLMVYAIGISCADLSLVQNIAQTIGNNQRSSNISIPLANMLSGGVKVAVNSGPGNMVQASYPSSDTEWTECNTDIAGSTSNAQPTVYVLGLTSSILVNTELTATAHEVESAVE